MRFVFRLALFAAVLTLPFAIPASAQYMYLDSNANGVHDVGDRMNANGTATTADLYVITNQNRDGSTATCDTGTEPLTINQYQVNLLAVNGTVTYSGFINQQSATMTFGFGEFNPDGVRYKNGFGGGTQLAPGNYRLCTITITGVGQTPRIDIVDQVVGSNDFTGFGTACLGNGFDNVYRLDGPNVIPATGAPGDFFDWDGLGAAGAVNTPPTVANPGNRTTNELANLAFTVTATDPDAGQTQTWSLTTGTPAATGATIGAATGAFSWTPTEAQGPGVYPVTVTATDNGTPPASGTAAFSITVNEVNSAPVVTNPGNKVVNELANLAFTVTATDSDIPANTITWSLTLGTPAATGATIGAGTGAFSWTPTEAQGPGTYPVTIVATDNGSPVLSGSAAITITVNEVNSAPVLAAIGNKTGTVGQPVTFTATATDSDIPANTLTFSLDAGAPAGATIGASTGAFSWTPSASGTFPVTVRVTDNGSPAMNDFEAISISVSSAPNQAPVLGAIGNKTTNELATLAFTATATDPDAGQTLTFSLDAGAPAGATIGAASGAFSWTPTEAQGPGSFPVTIRVTDNGSPSMSDFEVITITVNEVNSAPVVTNPGNRTIAELANLAFTVTATDSDVPANTITWSLTLGTPAATGATIGAGTGAFSWTPTEAQGPGTYPVTIVATDNGSPVMTGSAAITIAVTEVNSAPVVTNPGNKTVQANTPLNFTVTATDSDIPANTITWS